MVLGGRSKQKAIFRQCLTHMSDVIYVYNVSVWLATLACLGLEMAMTVKVHNYSSICQYPELFVFTYGLCIKVSCTKNSLCFPKIEYKI